MSDLAPPMPPPVLHTSGMPLYSADQFAARDAQWIELVRAAVELERQRATPIDMVLHCPACGLQHIDAVESGRLISSGANAGRAFPGWRNPPHRSHLCLACNHVWRPADVPTNGVAVTRTVGKHDSTPLHDARPAGTITLAGQQDQIRFFMRERDYWRGRAQELERLRDAWIACSERLPDENSVLVCWRGARELVVEEGFYCGGGRWMAGDGRRFNPGQVSHWMPMPAAPKYDAQGFPLLVTDGGTR